MDQLRDSDLHDDFLRDLEETGVYDLAAAVGIVENGEIVNLKQHQGEWAPHASMPLLAPAAPAGLSQPLGYGFQQQQQQQQLELPAPQPRPQFQPAQGQRLPQPALLPQAAGEGASLGRRLPLEAAGIDASELAAADAAVVACLQAAAEAALVVQMARAKLAQHGPHAAAAAGAAQPAPAAAAPAAAGAGAASGPAAGASSEPEAAAGRPQLRPRRGAAAVKLEDVGLMEDAAGGELEAVETAGAKRKRSTRAGAAAATAAVSASAAASAVQSQALTVAARVTGKGLRHFSLKLCEVVEKCGRTTYSQVADELVKEMLEEGAAGGAEAAAAAAPPDEKNIRRRVYDALNVLMAIGIIRKEKKEIVWSGWPEGLACNSAHLQEAERGRAAARVEQKAKQLEDMLAQQTSLAGLILRNRGAPLDLLLLEAQQEVAKGGGPPQPNPLQLPFMLVQAPGGADVEVSVSEDSRLAELNFHSWPFQIFDDESVLRMMRIGAPPDQLLRAFSAARASHAGWGRTGGGGGAGSSGAGGSAGLQLQGQGRGMDRGVGGAGQQLQQQQQQQAQQAQQPAEWGQQGQGGPPAAYGALGLPSTVPQLRPRFDGTGWTGFGGQQHAEPPSRQQPQQHLLPLQQAAFPAQPMLRPALRPADTTPGAAAGGSRRLPTPAAAAAAALLPPTPLSDLPWESPGSSAGQLLPQLRQRQQGLDQLGAGEQGQGQGGAGLQMWGPAVPPNPFQDGGAAPSRRQQRR